LNQTDLGENKYPEPKNTITDVQQIDIQKIKFQKNSVQQKEVQTTKTIESDSSVHKITLKTPSKLTQNIKSRESNIKINKDASLMAMILTSRNGEKARTAIRNTWLSDEFSKSRGVFLVGKDFCPHYRTLRSDPSSCELDNSKLTPTGEIIDQKIQNLQDQYVQLENNNTELLDNEQNLIMLPMTDTYKNLTLKVKLGVKWMVENTNAKWLLKVDDDTYTDLRGLEKYLEQFDHTKPYLIGRMIGGARVMTSESFKDRRWIDDKYDGTRYPKYASGAAGYVISRAVAEYIATSFSDLEDYVLEDASMGIWIDQSPLKNSITWIRNWDQFWTSGRCIWEQNKRPFVIGHKLGPEKIQKCHDYLTKKLNSTINMDS